MEMRCKVCNKKPSELKEYIIEAEDCECTPEEYVRYNEGTFNRETGLFYCTECYIKVGLPLGKG